MTLEDALAAGFAQRAYPVRSEWSTEGLDRLGGDCSVLVIVDVLSFTTSVDIALGRGARIQPLAKGDEAAKAGGAVLAGERTWTLRPSSLVDIPAGTLLAVPSPNGARLCARAASTGATVIAGCLRNAPAVARAALELAGDGPIGLIPAGERWGVTDGPLRPCLEDHLGAGAIAAALLDLGAGPASPEASLAAAAYRSVDDPRRTLLDCVSGRELIAHEDVGDVELAAQAGVSATVPLLTDGVLGERG